MHKKRRRSTSGQAMVEFALALPLVLLFLVAIIYFGRAFYTKQIVTMATQEGTRFASRVPGLSNNETRDFVRGFTVDGEATNIESPIYSALSVGHLLDGPGGTSGNLPAGSRVEILPFDDDSPALAPGTVSVRIQYPFKFVSSSSFGTIGVWTGQGGPQIPFADTIITEQAVAAQEVF